MATQSNLMSLPNELFDYFLMYLSSCDSVQSFYGLNKRMNMLLYRYIHRIDVSNQTNEWLNRYLPSLQPLITTMKFTHDQLLTLFPDPATIDQQYPALKSIIWHYHIGIRDYQSISHLIYFKTKISCLKFHLHSDENINVDENYIALLLLQKDALIEQLTFEYGTDSSPLWLSLKPKTLKSNSYLKRLTIKVHCVHHLFILIESLPKLEYLNVEICEVNQRSKYNYRSLRRKLPRLSRCLKEVLIDSVDFSYNRLLLFLEPFQQSIEYLTLHMLLDDPIDGTILETTLISKLPQLKQFQFAFIMFVDEEMPVDEGLNDLISTFSSNSYWSHHPVMCYYEESDSTLTMLSLPWILRELDPITNDIVNYRTNTSSPLRMTHVKMIYLSSTKITLSLIQFIKETFIRLKAMIICWYTCTLDEQVIEQKNNIQLETVKALHYYGSSHHFEYIQFLFLTPNIRHLTIDGAAIDAMNTYAQDNEQISSICEQITRLNVYQNLGDCDIDETKENFSNALIFAKDH